VTEGMKIKVEKLAGEIGDSIALDTLFVGTDKEVQVGAPLLEKSAVTAKIIAHDKHDKVKGIKHKAKKRYLVHFGHRQPYTELEITSIKA
jgi:large subunit ribosomal protein L21